MEEQNKNKIDKLSTFAKNPELAVFDEIQEVNQSLKALVDKETPESKPLEKLKVEIEGVEVLTLKGDKGDVGEKGDAGEKGEMGLQGERGADSTVPGPRGDRGEMGEAGLDGEKGTDGINGKDGSPDTGEQIIDKINEAEGLIKREKVEGLDDEFKKVAQSISNIPRGGGGRASHSTKFYKLTPDGTTKVFTVPKSVTSIVLMSDSPNVLFEGAANGFTINATRTSITLTIDNAPSVGSQLLYQYSEMFNT